MARIFLNICPNHSLVSGYGPAQCCFTLSKGIWIRTGWSRSVTQQCKTSNLASAHLSILLCRNLIENTTEGAPWWNCHSVYRCLSHFVSFIVSLVPSGGGCHKKNKFCCQHHHVDVDVDDDDTMMMVVISLSLFPLQRLCWRWWWYREWYR